MLGMKAAASFIQSASRAVLRAASAEARHSAFNPHSSPRGLCDYKACPPSAVDKLIHRKENSQAGALPGRHRQGSLLLPERLQQPKVLASSRLLALRKVQMTTNASNGAEPKTISIEDEILFGPYKIRTSEMFFESKLSRALVNLKPIVPGHVLIVPKDVVKRFADLSSEQVADLWLTAQKVGTQLEKHFGATSLTYAIQDGPQAGQTVPHVHIHVLPRKEGDFENNDEIYNEIDKGEKGLSDKLKVDSERKARSLEDMAKEAATLRALFI